MGESKMQPSFMEKLDIVFGQMAVFATGIYSAITGFFRGDDDAASYQHHVTHSMIRKAMSRLSTAQIRYLNPEFRTCYQKFCKDKNLEPNIVTFKSGIEGFWLGDPSAKYVFIYFHGGGYALDGDVHHLLFYHSIQADLARAGKSVALLCIAYSLTPHARYPKQICEGVDALNYLLEEKRRSTSEIIIGGDSAGAAISLAIVSHLSHPSPDFPSVKDHGRIKAIVLIAPWTSFNFDWPSCKGNKDKDCLARQKLQEWSAEYKAGEASNNFMEAVEAPASWWEGVHVEDLLCTAGGEEIFLDSISAWVEKYKSVNPDATTFVVGKGEGHIAPIIEPMLMDSTETEQGKAIKAWLKARL